MAGKMVSGGRLNVFRALAAVPAATAVATTASGSSFLVAAVTAPARELLATPDELLA